MKYQESDDSFGSFNPNLQKKNQSVDSRKESSHFILSIGNKTQPEFKFINDLNNTSSEEENESYSS